MELRLASGSLIGTPVWQGVPRNTLGFIPSPQQYAPYEVVETLVEPRPMPSDWDEATVAEVEALDQGGAHWTEGGSGFRFGMPWVSGTGYFHNNPRFRGYYCQDYEFEEYDESGTRCVALMASASYAVVHPDGSTVATHTNAEAAALDAYRRALADRGETEEAAAVSAELAALRAALEAQRLEAEQRAAQKPIPALVWAGVGLAALYFLTR